MTTRLRHKNAAMFAGAALACVLALAGCKDTAKDPAAADPPTEAASEEPTPEPSKADLDGMYAGGGETEEQGPDDKEEPVKPEQVEQTEPPAPKEVSPDQCVLGSWQVENQDFEEMMNALVANSPDIPAGMTPSIAVTGGSYFRFDDQGNFFSWRDNFTFTMSAGGEKVTFVSNSSETGQYGTVLGFKGLSGTHPTDFLWVDESMIIATDEVMNVAGVTQVIDRGGNGVELEVFGAYRGCCMNLASSIYGSPRTGYTSTKEGL